MIATIILAAGGSTRLGGKPKQLLIQDGTTLIRRITSAALSLETGLVLVVLGANREHIEPELDGLPVQLVHNSDWRDGLASSLRVGLRALPNETVDAFLVLLTDQPFVTSDLLKELISTHQQTGKGIVACRYGEAGHLGVPALFSIRYKTEFMNLSGDVGARKLIQQHTDNCVAVTFPLAAVDLDTPEDVENWQSPLSSLPLPPKWPDF